MSRASRFAVLSLVISTLAPSAYGQYQTFDMHPPGAVVSYFNSGNQLQQVGSSFAFGGAFSATLWTGTSASAASLHNASWDQSDAYFTDGLQQVGFANLVPGTTHAILWNGTAASAVDLHPGAPYEFSIGTGVSNGYQCGYAGFSTVDGVQQRGFVWSGTAASAMDITPSDLSTVPLAIDGTKVVGWSQLRTELFGGTHAVLWNDFTQTVVVDLNPASDFFSAALGLSGNQQVGYAYDPVAGSERAALWTGTAASYVDLCPSFSERNAAYGTNGNQQVGVAWTVDQVAHAVVWSGTASSCIDLHQFLPPGAVESQARGIDSEGNIYGFATVPFQDGYAQHAIIWKPVAVNNISNFLQPINDPATPESSFKKGSTVPVKFRLTDADSNPISGATATISLVLLGATETPVNEGDFVAPADTGNLFRDAGNGQYVYNLSTKNLLAGARYRITATVGGTSHSVTISIR